MNKYKATAVVSLHTGNVEVAEAQAKRRGNKLSKNDDGSYRIERPVQFKAGEEFGYDGTIPKVQLAAIEVEAEVEVEVVKKVSKKVKSK